MAHTIVTTDNMAGTRQGALLRSFKYFANDGVTRLDVDNGNVVAVKALMTDEREVFVAQAPAVDTPLSELLLVAGVEVLYSSEKVNLDEWYNAADDASPIRGYYFIPGAVFSVTGEAFANGAPTVGQVVELAAGSTLLNNVAVLTGGSTKIGEVLDIYVNGTKTFYSVLVKPAAV
jgi:hypothetical protein